jgi:glycosyltransferase involved in cell wall biosynthesis
MGFRINMRRLFASVSMVVVPTFYGTGLNNRLLEAISACMPVVTTPQALATLQGSQPDHHALTASRPTEFADQVVDVLQQESLRKRLSRGARELALMQPTWQDTLGLLERALRDIA